MKSYVTWYLADVFPSLTLPQPYTGFLVNPPKGQAHSIPRPHHFSLFAQPRRHCSLGMELQSRICSLHQPVTLFYIFVSVAQAPLFCNFFIWGLGQRSSEDASAEAALCLETFSPCRLTFPQQTQYFHSEPFPLILPFHLSPGSIKLLEPFDLSALNSLKTPMSVLIYLILDWSAAQREKEMKMWKNRLRVQRS